jgi:hypothetical protein
LLFELVAAIEYDPFIKSLLIFFQFALSFLIENPTAVNPKFSPQPDSGPKLISLNIILF